MTRKEVHEKLIDKIKTESIDKILNTYKELMNLKNKWMYIELCFILFIYLEDVLTRIIIKFLKEYGKNVKLESYLRLVNKLDFRAKVEWVENEIKGDASYKNFKPFFQYCKDYNMCIRNDLFHCRFENIKYKGRSIYNDETQRKIFLDLEKASWIMLKTLPESPYAFPKG